jgi:long-subunit fatty acid transport protein
MLQLRIIVVTAVVLVGLAGTASASPVDLFGYGARGGAMAGAIISSAADHEAVYYNPAALAFAERPTFAIGFQRADFFLELEGEESPGLGAPALFFGFGVPLPFGGFLKKRLTLGLGFVLPQTSILIAAVPAPSQPSFLLVENRAQTVSLQGGLGLRVTDWLSVGVGFLALAELIGDISVAPNDEGRLGSRVRDQVIADYSPVFGVLAKPTDWMAVGATYHGESSAAFELPITAELGSGFSIPIPRLDLVGTAQYDPRQVSAEASFVPSAGVRVAVGATWKQWSAFQNPIVYTAVPENLPTELCPQKVAGAEEGQVGCVQPAPEFTDTIVPRLGAEWVIEVGAWEVIPRAGLAWEPSPVPEQDADQNYLDNDRLIVAAGLGVRYDDISVRVAGQWQHLMERTETKRASLLADPESNVGYPEITHSGEVFFWGIELGLELEADR